MENYFQNFMTSTVKLMTNKIGIFPQAALRNQSRILKDFILKCPPSLCGLTIESTTKILHLCYGCLIFLHLQGYRFPVSETLSPRKEKAKLDGHYATLKFSLKRFRREGNDVMSGEQIEKGTNERLRGTHVYGVSIDRSKETESAKQ